MSDDVENDSLQTATTEGTQEENRSAIDEESEFDEEKNESKIVNINFLGCFIIIKYIIVKYFAIQLYYSKSYYLPEKRTKILQTRFIR